MALHCLRSLRCSVAPAARTALLGAIVASAAASAEPARPVDPQPGDATAPDAAQAPADVIRVPAGADTRTATVGDLTGQLPEELDAPTATAVKPGSSEWVVVPIPFKNPLLGAGLEGGVARLYKPADQPNQPRASMYGVGGMYAEGDSWALAAADRRYWADGKVRSTVAAGGGEVYYDLALDSLRQGLRAPVQQSFRGGVLDVAYHLGEHLWVGGGLKFASVSTGIQGFDLGAVDSSVFPGKYRMGILAIKAEQDSRSDEFYPTDGALLRADIWISTTVLGSDSDYVKYEVSYNRYFAFGDRNVLAWRIAGQTVTGNPPFFADPWYGAGVDLRGYTPGVYVGKSLLAAQAEWRWQATRKLGVVAFAGAGGVYGTVQPFRQDDWLPSGGLGLRWRVAEKYRVNFRVDYAWGKGDEQLLISVGEAF